jgi:AhpD family alkylhydroperoxidase
MEKNYAQFTKRISGDLRKLRKDIPDTMQAFSALAQAATRDGALDKKTKELIALALGIAARCDGCIGFHTETLVRLGATRQEVERDAWYRRLYGRRPVADVCGGRDLRL